MRNASGRTAEVLMRVEDVSIVDNLGRRLYPPHYHQSKVDGSHALHAAWTYRQEVRPLATVTIPVTYAVDTPDGRMPFDVTFLDVTVEAITYRTDRVHEFTDVRLRLDR
jgi:hypothetical protein